MIAMKRKVIIYGLVTLLVILAFSPMVYGKTLTGTSTLSNTDEKTTPSTTPEAIPSEITEKTTGPNNALPAEEPTAEPSSTRSSPSTSSSISQSSSTNPDHFVIETPLVSVDITETTDMFVSSPIPSYLDFLESFLPQLYISAPFSVTEKTPFIAYVYTLVGPNTTKPVPNATVTVSWSHQIYRTDKNGNVNLTAPSVDESTNHTIKASKKGFRSASFRIAITPAYAWIYGTVVDANTSLPIVNATVCAVADGYNSSSCVFTDVFGDYSIQVLPGVYTVTASKQDYLPGSVANITIFDNMAVEVNFSLKQILLPSPTRVHVDDSYDESTPGWGYDHFNNIQAGIHAVAVGGVVSVGSGTYYESISIEKSLWLQGNPETVIIDAGHQNHVVNITASNVMIDGFTIQNSGNYRAGILIDHAGAVYVINSIIQECTWGIALEHSTYSIIGENIIRDCSQIGILVEYSTSNLIAQNTISNNGMTGIHLVHQATNNTIYHNNFVDNVQSAYANGYNLWDSGSQQQGGNYWSDYTGVDENGDGIGDTAYVIPGGAGQDRYPLMFMFGVDDLYIFVPSQVLEGQVFMVQITSGESLVRDVAVTCFNMTLMTDSNGRVYFVAPQVSQTTTYLITADKPGYHGATKTITVFDQNSSLELEAPVEVWEKSWFTVQVTANGVPVSDVRLFWLYDGTSYYTGPNGTALVQAPTIYNSSNFTHDTLIAIKTGYIADFKSILIWNAKNLYLDTPTIVDENEWFLVTLTDDGQPISDARIYWQSTGQSFYTGPNGTALVQALSIPPGFNVTYDWLFAEKTGYSSYAVYITIRKNISQPLEPLEIHAPDSVYESTYFTVLVTANNTPIPGVTLRFMNLTYQTNASGYANVFALGILEDKYELLTATKTGYDTGSKMILVINKKSMSVTGPDEVYENQWFSINVSYNGQPIANASVHWFDYPYWTFTTDANGSANVLAHTVEGDLAYIYDYLVVSKEGFWDGGIVVKIINYLPLYVDAPDEVFEGTFFTATVIANNTPVPGVLVQFMNRTYSTNENGTATLYPLGVLYDKIELITATKSGYESGYRYILVKNKETLTIHAPDNVTEQEWFLVTVTSGNRTVSNVTLTWTVYGTSFITNETGSALVQAPPLVITNVSNGTVNYSGYDCLLAEKQGFWAGVECFVIHIRLGDMNLDGDVNFGDISAFVLGMTDRDAYISAFGQPPEPRGDINQDGSFDLDDIDPFVALLSG